jgi:galactokinase
MMQIREKFEKTFHTIPTHVFSAPGRTELSGNHTDHQHGRVLAAAVDLKTTAQVTLNGTDEIRVCSEGYAPVKVDIKNLEKRPDEINTTAALIRGVAAAFREKGAALKGFDAKVRSTVLPGSGLSSSAAFEVLVCAILDSLYNGFVVDAQQRAVIAQYAENVYFGKPSGLLDQSASAVGGLVTMDFAVSPASVEALRYDFGAKGYAVCVVSAGGEHGNLTGEYAAVPAEMRQVAEALGEKLLCAVTPQRLFDALPQLKNRVSDRAILRAFHFVDETRRVEDAVAALRADDLPAFFRAVIASGESSWKLLQNLYVPSGSNQEMPLALEMSRRYLEGRGAWRIHGGGFAGTILAFVPLDDMAGYTKYMEDVFGPGSVKPLFIRPEGAVKL